jgi:hypothetical protein
MTSRLVVVVVLVIVGLSEPCKELSSGLDGDALALPFGSVGAALPQEQGLFGNNVVVIQTLEDVL